MSYLRKREIREGRSGHRIEVARKKSRGARARSARGTRNRGESLSTQGEGEGEGEGERELAFLLSFLSNSWLLCFLANAKVVLQIAVMTTPPLPPLLPPPPPPSPSSPSPPLSPSCFPPTLSLSLSLSLLLLALPHHLPRSRAAVSLPRPFSPSAQ